MVIEGRDWVTPQRFMSDNDLSKLPSETGQDANAKKHKRVYVHPLMAFDIETTKVNVQGIDAPQAIMYVWQWAIEVVGANSRLDELQAGLLRVRLSHMEELTEERRKLAARYAKELHNDKLLLPKVREQADSVWHQYVIRCEERQALIDFLGEREIGTIIHYPIPPHLSEAYAYLGVQKGSLPVTEHYADTVLSIPMYNGMTEEEQEFVIGVLNAF